MGSASSALGFGWQSTQPVCYCLLAGQLSLPAVVLLGLGAMGRTMTAGQRGEAKMDHGSFDQRGRTNKRVK